MRFLARETGSGFEHDSAIAAARFSTDRRSRTIEEPSREFRNNRSGDKMAIVYFMQKKNSKYFNKCQKWMRQRIALKNMISLIEET